MRHILLILLLIAVCASPTHAQSPSEQLIQLVTQLQARPSDTALRERIIRLAQEIKPTPALPEEAERRLVRGGAAFKLARNPGDYKDAAREFELASNEAPWSGDIYYNLALVHEKVGNTAQAVAALKWAAMASPGSREIKTLMYEMEFKEERATKDRKAATAEAERKLASARALDQLRGTYYLERCTISDESGCNDTERRGSFWHRLTWENGSPWLASFTIRADGSIEAPDYIYWAGCNVSASPVTGTLNGVGLADIVWTVKPPGGSPYRVWAEASTDGRWVTFSCDRPLQSVNPHARYKYVTYYRP